MSGRFPLVAFVVSVFVSASGLSFGPGSCAQAQETLAQRTSRLFAFDSKTQPVVSDETTPASFSSEVEAGAKMLQLFAGSESEKPLEMIRAYKWANTARKPLGDRLCLLYLHHGKPVASCKIYPTGRRIVHTPISLTDLPIEGRIDGEVVWLPPDSDPEYKTLETEQSPAASAAARRIQMKRIVRKFQALTDEAEAERQKSVRELRLLPTPIHRYSSDKLREEGIIEGAVFCFVAEGGNPQVLMLLEAVTKDDQPRWRCGFSRRTFAELSVRYQDQEIWRVPVLRQSQMQKAGSFHRIVSPNPVVEK